jgi:NADPH-dependent curcumin reductase CurA
VRSRAFRLRRRPVGPPGGDDLELVSIPVPEPAAGEVLVRTLMLSLDPAARLWMSDLRGYRPPVPVGAVMEGTGIGEVIASRRDDVRTGQLVLGRVGWREHAVLPTGSGATVLPEPLQAALPAYLGVLGSTGLTAYVGLEIGRPGSGETVVVSAASGAVGSIAGQLARARGARAIGITGGPEKCRHVVADLGFDACVDRLAPDWPAQLDAATADGVDVDFENVGGEIMDRVLLRLNRGARVVLCGMISQYDAAGGGSAWAGQRSIHQILMQRATMRGFIVSDYADLFPAARAELGALLAAGRLQHEETVVDGFEQLPAAFGRLFTGEHTGKLVVRVAGPSATS